MPEGLSERISKFLENAEFMAAVFRVSLIDKSFPNALKKLIPENYSKDYYLGHANATIFFLEGLLHNITREELIFSMVAAMTADADKLKELGEENPFAHIKEI